MVSSQITSLNNPNVRVVFGPGSLENLGEEVARLNGRRVLVITGHSIADKTPILGRAVSILGERNIHVETFKDAIFDRFGREEPMAHLLQQAQESKPDVLVSIGGGTVIAYAVGLASRLAGGSFEAAKIPIITIPTTLSGAEANAGYGVHQGQRRSDPRLRAVTAILDPELTIHTPYELFASSGFNALAHCVEGIYSKSHTPWTDAYFLQSLRLVMENLGPSMSNPEDMDLRGKVLMGGYMSMMGTEVTGWAVAHALCHGLFVMNSPHGLNYCVMLPHGMRYNLDVAAERLAMLAPVMGVLPRSDPRETAMLCISAVESLRTRLGLPGRLRDVPEVVQNKFPEAAERAFVDTYLYCNPRQPANAQELQKILEAAW